MISKIKYRPEIDGLRTIAVLSVIFFHAKFYVNGQNPISGGYLGVDIFFVISGYLISSIILGGLKDNNFSFLEFYIRRARRILPILFTVILASLPFAWMLLFPREILEFTNTIFSSLFFYSNFIFYFEDSYWALNSNLKPLLHTWSLAVEEQFYLIAPLFLMFLIKFPYRVMFTTLILLFLASLIFTDWASKENASMAFYLLPGRIWELLAGVLLAVYENKRGRNISGGKVKIIPTIGMILIFSAIFIFDNETVHPSIITIIPIVGTVLIIWFSHPNEIITKILSSKPFVGIGLISFGLYMWHLPIFVFSRMHFPGIWKNEKLSLIIITFIISITTYFLIEKPFRNPKIISLKRFFIPSTLLALSILIIFSAIVFKNDGIGSRFNNLGFDLYNKHDIQWDNRLLQRDSWKHVRENDQWKRVGLEPSQNKKKKFLILGNSHGKDLFNAFYLNPDRFSEFEFLWTHFNLCHSDINKVVESKKFKEADYIILKNSKTVTKRKNLPCFLNVVDTIKKQNKKIILATKHNYYATKIASNNGIETRYLRKGPKGGYTIVDQSIIAGSSPKKEVLGAIAYKKLLHDVLPISKKYNDISKNLNIGYLNLTNIYCDHFNQRCNVLTPNDKKIHYDADHWTIEGARYFGQLIADKELLKKSM